LRRSKNVKYILSFNSFKVLLEQFKVEVEKTLEAALSILLKSYWNHLSEGLNSVFVVLSILLKSYWNRLELSRHRRRLRKLSILLKSYWNSYTPAYRVDLATAFQFF